MSLAKVAQHAEPVELDHDLLYLHDDSLNIDDDKEEEEEDEDDIEMEEDKDHEPHMHGKGEIIVLINDDKPVEKNFEFVLPLVPGGEIQDEIEEDDNDLNVEEEDDEVEVESPDTWDWQSRGLNNFVSWLKGMLDNTPRHSGVDSTGLERAISYLESLNRIISKAVRTDLKDELNVGSVEKMRDEIHKGIERLEERLDKIVSNKYKKNKKKKKADEENGLVKEGQKIAGIKGITVTVPLLISHIARVCINGTVSAGKDMDDTFKKLAEKYKLSMREKAECVTLINDMGFPLRHREVDFDSDFNPSSEDNSEYLANYPA